MTRNDGFVNVRSWIIPGVAQDDPRNLTK